MSGETLMPQEVKTIEALKDFVNLYKGDGDLVRPGAEKHHVQVVEGDVFDSLSKGHYNFRIPRIIDSGFIQKLTQAKKIAIICEDYRQSAEVVSAHDLHPENGDDAVFGIAGGAAQPEPNRFNALVNLISSIADANPDIQWVLAVHDEVCGGANNFTNGEMKQIKEQQGTKAEQTRMYGFLNELVSAVIGKGVKKENIQSGMAVVENNKFIAWK